VGVEPTRAVSLDDTQRTPEPVRKLARWERVKLSSRTTIAVLAGALVLAVVVIVALVLWN
jgi:hypothetical protein